MFIINMQCTTPHILNDKMKQLQSLFYTLKTANTVYKFKITLDN